MTKKQGFTLVELLVGLVIGGIIILSIGVISDISQKSYQKVLREANIYNDITYGFKLMQNRVHTAVGLGTSSPGGVWIGQRLLVNNQQGFGVCQSSGNSPKNLVYMPIADSNCTNPEIIFYVSSSESLNFSSSISGDTVTVQVSGEKNKIKFDMSMAMTRRSQ